MDILWQYILVVITSFTTSVFGQLCTDTGFTLTKKDTTSADSVLGSYTVPQRAECIVLCLKDISCVSVEYTRSSGHCLTHDIKVNQIGTTYEQGTDIYEISGSRTVPLPVCDILNGYTHNSIANFCYKAHTERQFWETARRTCNQEGGDLAKLDTLDRKMAANIIVQADGSNDYHIGAKYVDGSWRWVIDNSEVMDYSKTSIFKKCLKLDQTPAYAMTACVLSWNMFICEIDLTN